jgi:hypothetical protein
MKISKEKRQEYYKRFREKHPNWRKEWDKTHLDSIKNSELKQDFGLTLNRYNQFLEKQRGVCAVCGCPETRKANKGNKIKRLAVDHCHNTKKVRGLLCQDCNIMLGLAKENVTIFQNAITYLLKNDI